MLFTLKAAASVRQKGSEGKQCFQPLLAAQGLHGEVETRGGGGSSKAHR